MSVGPLLDAMGLSLLEGMMHRLARNGKCCGRKPQWYATKGYYYCHKCNYTYSASGEPLGVWGSGLTMAERHAQMTGLINHYRTGSA